jgi:hypothetical protein
MVSRSLLCALLIGSQILLCGAASMNRAEPPLSPDGEPVMSDPDTAAYCFEQATELSAKLDKAPESAGYFKWTLGTPLVSANDTWGIVCRIDFKMAGGDVSPRVNRLVLYIGADKLNFMIAIGQDIAPLYPERASDAE